MSVNAQNDQSAMLFMSNRWVNSIYPGYGLIKQRVFRLVMQECQKQIRAVGNGYPIEKFDFFQDQAMILDLPISKISHYNNYHQVRRAIGQMCSIPIAIHDDPTFKEKDPNYIHAPLFLAFSHEADGVVRVRIKRDIAALLLHVHSKQSQADKRKYIPYHYTEVDTKTLDTLNNYCRSKYTYPLYSFICSYKQGVTITVADLRRRLQVEDKYKGFDNFNRYVLQYVQKLLADFGGKYCFNYAVASKTGRTITSLRFSVFENKNTANVDHTWVKIQRALTQELPYFMRITDDQREEFNYLYTGKYDLDAVLRKFQDVHKILVRKRENNERFNVFPYTLVAIHNDFPPRAPT